MSSSLSSSLQTDPVFEEEVIRNPLSLTLWLGYASLLKKSPSTRPASLFAIYERALLHFPASYKIWRAYLIDVVKAANSSHNRARAVRVFERSLIFMNKSPIVWHMYLSFVMSCSEVTSVRLVHNRALQSLPVTQHDSLWESTLRFMEAVCPEAAVVLWERRIKMDPTTRVRFLDLCKARGLVDRAVRLMATLVDETRDEALWRDLSELLSREPGRAVSIEFEEVVRAAIHISETEVGGLWCALGDYLIRRGKMEKARNVFEEGMAASRTMRDFSLIYDAYSQFEETLLTAQIEAEADDDVMELHMARLERLVDRLPDLRSQVLLRQNPHNVEEWLRRVALFKDRPEKVVEIYSEAARVVDPARALGNPNKLWIGLAQLFEGLGDLGSARAVLTKATEAPFAHGEDLAGIWIEAAELEIRHDQFAAALDVMRKATSFALRRRSLNKQAAREAASEAVAAGIAAKRAIAAGLQPLEPKVAAEQAQKVQDRLWRVNRLWAYFVDLEESLGTFESCRAVYEQMLGLRVANPQQVLNYAAFLEERQHFEDAFKVYERGIELFVWPQVGLIWEAYLARFVARYGGSKLERVRDLFEQALASAPAEAQKKLFLQYAAMEAAFGLSRHHMKVLDRACQAVPAQDKLDFYLMYISTATEVMGAPATREIYQKGIETLPDRDARRLCLQFAELEVQLGEIERARAVLAHGSQFANPGSAEEDNETYWRKFNDFEIAHGDQDSFKEMLRLKRTVAATYESANINAVLLAQGEKEKKEAKQKERDGIAKLEQAAREQMERLEAVAAAQGNPHHHQPKAANPDEIDLGDDSDDSNNGSDDASHEKRPAQEEAQGALERLKRQKKN